MQILTDIAGPAFAAIASLIFVLTQRPRGWKGIRGVLYIVIVGVLIFVGQAWYKVRTGETPSDTAIRYAGCFLFWFEANCTSPPAALATEPVVTANVAAEPDVSKKGAAVAAVDPGQLCLDEHAKYATSRHAREAGGIYILDRGPIDYNPAIYDDLLASCDAVIGQSGQSRAVLADILYYKAVLLFAPNATAANPDLPQIMELMSRSADAGNVAAAFDAGNLYWFGRSEVQSPEKAHKYLELAAVAGLPAGMLHFGSFLEAGPEAFRDYDKACDWFQRAGETDIPAGRMAIGYCFAFGRGRSVNIPAALSWYKPVAEEGWPEAQFMMGFLNCEAQPPFRDREQCRVWLQKAARSGFRGAEETARGYGISLTD